MTFFLNLIFSFLIHTVHACTQSVKLDRYDGKVLLLVYIKSLFAKFKKKSIIEADIADYTCTL